MKEKINQTAGRLKQTVRAVGVGIATLTCLVFLVRTGLCRWCAGQSDCQGNRETGR